MKLTQTSVLSSSTDCQQRQEGKAPFSEVLPMEKTAGVEQALHFPIINKKNMRFIELT